VAECPRPACCTAAATGPDIDKSAGCRVEDAFASARRNIALEHVIYEAELDQATWNLLERSATQALERAHAAAVGVIVKEALATGRLSAAGLGNSTADLAGEHELAPDALALAAVLNQPCADVVLSGAGLPEQLRSNLAAMGYRRRSPVAGEVHSPRRARRAVLGGAGTSLVVIRGSARPPTSWRPGASGKPARSAGRPRRRPGSARASGRVARTRRRSFCR
jgi:hypothetical protein